MAGSDVAVIERATVERPRRGIPLRDPECDVPHSIRIRHGILFPAGHGVFDTGRPEAQFSNPRLPSHVDRRRDTPPGESV
ncbi:hypothetical protein YT1_4528 [Rhodococcus ruber]|nr:hypothetical protein YT1_4528 [Rhodococcus ruber]